MIVGQVQVFIMAFHCYNFCRQVVECREKVAEHFNGVHRRRVAICTERPVFLSVYILLEPAAQDIAHRVTYP